MIVAEFEILKFLLPWFLMFTDYENDPYSEGDSCNAICCRGDLKKDNPRPDGCYDTKVILSEYTFFFFSQGCINAVESL